MDEGMLMSSSFSAWHPWAESRPGEQVRVLFQFQQVNWNCLLQTPRAACPRALLNPIPQAALSFVPLPVSACCYHSFSWNSHRHRRVHTVPDILRGINFYRPRTRCALKAFR